jgi:solute carrier family 25 carnitine/acylcarnitine transporter 20/29
MSAMEEVKPARSALAEQARSFVGGGVGGICAVITGHPFDLVKVRLQTAEKGVYTGALDVVKKTIAREGLVRVCIGTPPAVAHLTHSSRVSTPESQRL